MESCSCPDLLNRKKVEGLGSMGSYGSKEGGDQRNMAKAAVGVIAAAAVVHVLLGLLNHLPCRVLLWQYIWDVVMILVHVRCVIVTLRAMSILCGLELLVL
jgi:hypothetical protein